MYILSSGDISYFVYYFETKKKLSCMLTKFNLKQVTNVLSVDILAKFQRPFMKPYNFTTRRHRITTKITLDLLDGLVCHYVSCE